MTNEPTLSCPKCRSDIRLTDPDAKSAIDEMVRQEINRSRQEIAERESAAKKRERAIAELARGGQRESAAQKLKRMFREAAAQNISQQPTERESAAREFEATIEQAVAEGVRLQTAATAAAIWNAVKIVLLGVVALSWLCVVVTESRECRRLPALWVPPLCALPWLMGSIWPRKPSLRTPVVFCCVLVVTAAKGFVWVMGIAGLLGLAHEGGESQWLGFLPPFALVAGWHRFFG